MQSTKYICCSDQKVSRVNSPVVYHVPPEVVFVQRGSEIVLTELSVVGRDQRGSIKESNSKIMIVPVAVPLLKVWMMLAEIVIVKRLVI